MVHKKLHFGYFSFDDLFLDGGLKRGIEPTIGAKEVKEE